MRTVLTVTIEHDRPLPDLMAWAQAVNYQLAKHDGIHDIAVSRTQSELLTVRGEAVDVAEFVDPLSQSRVHPVDDEVGDGWIEWHGGERPVGEFDDVDVVWRSGEQFNDCQANCWVWSHSDDEDDIIRYRIAGGK